MNSITVIAQILGISAMITTVVSMQCRSNKGFFALQEISGGLFCISFIMLGAWAGALMNVFGTIRPELLRREKFAKTPLALIILLLLLAAFTAATAYLSPEKWYLLLITTVAQLCGTCFMWTRNGKYIRLNQLCITSPLWIAYNLLLPMPSIGGILTDVINMISVSLALYRYRKAGFTE